MEPFDCDYCGKETTGDTYQDETGNMFVCEDCFDEHNDGVFFIKPDKPFKESDHGILYSL